MTLNEWTYGGKLQVKINNLSKKKKNWDNLQPSILPSTSQFNAINICIILYHWTNTMNFTNNIGFTLSITSFFKWSIAKYTLNLNKTKPIMKLFKN